MSKNVKRHVFLKSEKKRKIRVLEHWLGCAARDQLALV